MLPHALNLSSLTYTSSSSGLTLETAQFAGGVIRSGNSQEINYFITDHLGSVRSIVNASGAVVEQNDYYAFGAKHVRSDYPQNSNRFDFNGKEEQTTGDLDYLDYGARMYDPMIGRWFNTDPLAEKFYPLSQYNYALNNPVFFIDPDGMAADGYILNNYGEIKRLDNTGGDKYDVLYSSDKQNSLRVNDTSILPGLASTGYSSKDKNGRYTLTWAWGNPDDLRSLFLFASHNSSVEWRFSRFDIGFGDQYALGTKHDESHSPNPEQMGFTLESEIAFVHNHPTPWQTLREEIRSMGWLDTGRKDPATGRPLIDRQGDTWNIWDDQINGGPRANTHSYAYFPHSGNLWHIGGMYGVSYIRNINGDSRRFFFGTLNHK